jgi:hypothetical protein
MTKGTFETLLERIEAAGYVDAEGHPLTNSRDWHEMRQIIQQHPGWPGRYTGNLRDYQRQAINHIDKVGTLEMGLPPWAASSEQEKVGEVGERRYSRISDDGWETMESAPLDGRPVQLRLRNYHGTVVAKYTTGRWVRVKTGNTMLDPTHWRPIRER